jgi:SAM-dependent methyltransferase
MNCRYCNTDLVNIFVDLINSPPSNSFLNLKQLNGPETYYPLKLYVCHSCFLVQVDEYKSANEIFSAEYAYHSSFSKSWLQHAKEYANMMINEYAIGRSSFVVEIASNDGYLLQYFQEHGISVLGIEPSKNTADVARNKGIESLSDFFGSKLAKEKFGAPKEKADLLIANNVLAHVPDVNDFVSGLKIALKETGIITLEFPHLVKLIEQNQFDTIYHEHFSYFSFTTINKIFATFGLTIFNVQEISTHGGSLRIFAKHDTNTKIDVNTSVAKLLSDEYFKGITDIEFYKNFHKKIEKVKFSFWELLVAIKKENKKIIAYGAAAKGNTLLNYCGVKKDTIPYCADASTFKQGLYMPGSHIEIISPDEIPQHKPDYILILPWNIKDEVIKELRDVNNWNAKFIVLIPDLKIFD